MTRRTHQMELLSRRLAHEALMCFPALSRCPDIRQRRFRAGRMLHTRAGEAHLSLGFFRVPAASLAGSHPGASLGWQPVGPVEPKMATATHLAVVSPVTSVGSRMVLVGKLRPALLAALLARTCQRVPLMQPCVDSARLGVRLEHVRSWLVEMSGPHVGSGLVAVLVSGLSRHGTIITVGTS